MSSLLCMCIASVCTEVKQLSIPRVDELPNEPSPMVLIDWHEKSLQLHNFLFKDPRAVNSTFFNFSSISTPLYKGPIFCLPSYLGEYTSLSCRSGGAGEGLAVIGAALGGVLTLGSGALPQAALSSLKMYASPKGPIWNNPVQDG